jgi:putative phage-type endonuclease
LNEVNINFLRLFQAAIVGYRTRKVLFLGVKNKYCTSCARAEAKDEAAKPHTCYKNWGMNQSSTSMEAAIICEGFRKSEEMYKIRYDKLIADGDSSVYKKILESRPYKHLTVEKVECKNHLLRNMCTKLKAVTCSKTEKSSVVLRKKIGDNLLRCRVAVTKATQHRKSEDRPITEKINNLREDILNIPSHVFGEHKRCAERGYFCELDASTAPASSNLVPDLISVGLYPAVEDIFRHLSRHSRSLLIDVTSNYVEHFNSIVAKFVGGKRINFAQGGSYQGRCAAAVVQHNSGRAHYNFHKIVYNSSPGTFSKSNEMKRKQKVDQQRKIKGCRKSLFVTNSNEEIDYGLSAQRPDIDDETMRRECEEYLVKLKKTDEECQRIERETQLQADSSEWLELRRSILTASHFGRICKMRPTTGCESVVKQILYSAFDCEAMLYGRKNEETARQELEKEIGENVQKCGIFIDKEHFFLGGSPDGLVNENATVEIKCPSSAKDLTPDEAIKNKKVTFWTIEKNGEIGEIKKNHDFYYQVQGQLRVTGRQFCYFVLWTSKGIKVAKIARDDAFWETSMFPKLKKFYMDCLLPEIIDPRHSRSMPIRNPLYIEEERQKAEKRTGVKRKKETEKRTEESSK